MIRFLPGWILIFIVGLIFLLPALAHAEIGWASWYGTESGNRTADGERFTGRSMTAAHRSLKFGTRVKVTNLKNGRSVVVRINDRGPAKWTHRAIDVSRTAARGLGMLQSGTARVRITVLGSK